MNLLGTHRRFPDLPAFEPPLGALDHSGFLLFAAPFPSSRAFWMRRQGLRMQLPDLPTTQVATRSLDAKPQTSAAP
eukprot:4549331-Amphidinium_carterae.1